MASGSLHVSPTGYDNVYIHVYVIIAGVPTGINLFDIILCIMNAVSVLPKLIKIQGMVGGHSLGGACGHIKVHIHVCGLSLFPHQRKLCTESLLGRHALGMLGRTLCYICICKFNNTCSLTFNSCMYYSPCTGSEVPAGYVAQAIHGFVEELVVNDDPEYQVKILL